MWEVAKQGPLNSLQKHVNNERHKQNLAGTLKETFYEDLCSPFISASIALSDEEEVHFSNITKKHLQQHLQIVLS